MNSENLEDFSKKATVIQSRHRGNQVRKHYKKEIEDIKKQAKVLEVCRTDKYMIDLFQVELKKNHLTLDKFYRICDENMSRRITTKQFMEQINNLGIDYSEETKKRLVLVFDEDFNERITYAEFVDTCDAYGAELPFDLPANYISVSKRALFKLVKKMNKKNIKKDQLFIMKNDDNVSMQDFKNFIRNTLSLDLKKREEHALFLLCDTNKNNSIAKDEFVELLKKGERLLQEPPKPMKNNFLEPNAYGEDDTRGGRKSKPAFSREDSSMAYAGDPKEEFVKIIHASNMISIEQFFKNKCKWDEEDFITFAKFKSTANELFPTIPDADLMDLFEQLDFMGEKKIKVKNIIKELKNSLRDTDTEALSLLRITDIQSKYNQMSPRSGTSFVIQEIKDHCNIVNNQPGEIFNLARKPSKSYAIKEDLQMSFRQCLPKLSREIIQLLINSFDNDQVQYNEFLIMMDLKEVKRKTDDSSQKAQLKWIKKYVQVLNANGVDPNMVMKDADTDKNGIIDLKEFEKALKQYIKPDQLSFSDLQHILDSLDVNNDGNVTLSEYKVAIEKYGTNDEKDNAIKDSIEACRAKGTTLKKSISKCEFNLQGMVSVPILMKNIKSGTGFDNKQTNELIQLIKQSNDNEVSAEEIFKFYDTHLPDDINIDLEIKYII